MSIIKRTVAQIRSVEALNARGSRGQEGSAQVLGTDGKARSIRACHGFAEEKFLGRASRLLIAADRRSGKTVVARVRVQGLKSNARASSRPCAIEVTIR